MNKPRKLLGVFFAHNVFGNCFSPAVCLKTIPRYKQKSLSVEPAARFILTFRFNGAETRIYFNGIRFWWNSAHLARRFGNFYDTDFGGYSQLNHALIGCHTDI